MVVATKLPKEIFDVEVKNHELLKLAYESYLANSRAVSATTKQRGEVRGGGKKPWRQKGTGRARFGSSRNPIWRGGGIVFGPRGNENYKKKISTSSKRIAIKQALSLAHKAKKIVIDDIKSNGKTNQLSKFLNENNYKGNVLIVVEDKNENLLRSTSNLQNVNLINSMYLTVYQILNADRIIISPKSIETIRNWLQPKLEIEEK